MNLEEQTQKYTYDLFISYSTDPDYSLVRKIESFLETFHKLKTPKELPLRPLNACVDGSDFSLQKIQKKEGENAVATLIDDYLSRSDELLVLCSRNASKSPWVDQEIKWFLKHRGPEAIRLVVTEGKDPGAAPEEIFSPSIIESGLHTKPWYDFREAKSKQASSWVKVKNFDDERTRLAADLNGISAGEVQPIWYRQQRRTLRNRIVVSALALTLIAAAAIVAAYWGVVARKEEGLKFISDAYKVLYRDPSQAVIKAYRGHQLVPGSESETALKQAFKVAVLHHYNRRENARITGSGPSYLASRWKQGDVFTEDSPDGRFRLFVTERGEDGPNPPGEVYLLNNETLKVTKLEPCIGRKSRVEDVSFDQDNKHIFVTRYFNLSVYNTTGKCVGGYRFSRYTKSPMHLVEGYFADKYVLGSETKGGLWLVVPNENEETYSDRKKTFTLQEEFHGDPALFASFSSDRRRAVMIFESGRSAVLLSDGDIQDKKQLALLDLNKKGVLFAGFYPGDDNRLITTGADGVIRVWSIIGRDVQETRAIPVGDTALDWVTVSEDGSYILAVGSNQSLYIIDTASRAVAAVINYANEIDWAAARAVTGKTETARATFDSSKPEVKALDDPKLKVFKVLNVEGESWLLTSDNDLTYALSGKPYRVIDGQAYHYPGFPDSITSIKKIDDYYWFEGGPLYRFVQGGGIQVIPGKGITVTEVMRQGDDYWLATSQGLYRWQPQKLTRLASMNLPIKRLYRIGDTLYVSTKRGAYILERGMLIRLTDPFLDIADIKQVGGKTWMLTKTNRMFEDAGPLYVVDGYFSRMVGESDWQVEDVFEAGGRLWISTLDGFYQYSEGQFKKVLGINKVVTSMQQWADKWVLSSRSSGVIKGLPTSYALDINTLTASPLEFSPMQWTKYGSDYLSLTLKYDGNFLKTAMHRVGDQVAELDIQAGEVHQIKEVNGQAWLATDAGPYRMVDGKAKKVAGINLTIKSILPLGDEIWLRAEQAVVRIHGDQHQTFELVEHIPHTIKKVDGTVWILTNTRELKPGPVYRIHNGRLNKVAASTDAISDVVKIDDSIWLITRKGAKAGPLFNFSAEVSEAKPGLSNVQMGTDYIF